jgi:hypothetical protein
MSAGATYRLFRNGKILMAYAIPRVSKVCLGEGDESNAIKVWYSGALAPDTLCFDNEEKAVSECEKLTNAIEAWWSTH